MCNFPTVEVIIHSTAIVSRPIILQTIDDYLFHSSIKVSTLEKIEPQCYEEIKKACKENLPHVVYYNKGL